MGTYDQSIPVYTGGHTYDQSLYMGAYDQSFNPAVQYFPPLNAIPPPRPASRKRTASDPEDDIGPGPAKRAAVCSPSDVVYRLLVSSGKVGRVIGKQGARIRELREASGVQIKITDPLSKGEDRVIMISSRDAESAESGSAAEQMLLRVASMVVDQELDDNSVATPAGTQQQPQGAMNLTRLVIGRSQAGCLIGKEGSIIKEIRERSGASIRVMPPDLMPFSSSISELDRLVQVSGELAQVQEALKLIARKLRENPPKESITLLKPTYHQQLMRYAQALYPGGYGMPYNGSSTLPVLHGGLEYHHQPGAVPPTIPPSYGIPYDGSSTVLVLHGGLEYHHQPGAAPPTVPPSAPISVLPKVTTEMNVPKALMGGVIGRGGVNITHVRSLSGCAVKVHAQEDGKTDRRITFEGTAEQVSAAQSLVQGFMSAQ